MTTPIFSLLNNDPAVVALLKADGILRAFDFGLAPDQPTTPYVVWQTVAGNPSNYLADRPKTDRELLQIDVYATTAASARAVFEAVRGAIELDCYVVNYRNIEQEPDTRLYRIGFDTTWLVNR